MPVDDTKSFKVVIPPPPINLKDAALTILAVTAVAGGSGLVYLGTKK